MMTILDSFPKQEIAIPYDGAPDKVRSPEHGNRVGFFIADQFVPDWRVVFVGGQCAACGCDLPPRRADIPGAGLCSPCFAERCNILADAISGRGAEHTARVAAEVVNGGGIGNLRKAVKK